MSDFAKMRLYITDEEAKATIYNDGGKAVLLPAFLRAALTAFPDSEELSDPFPLDPDGNPPYPNSFWKLNSMWVLDSLFYQKKKDARVISM